MSPRRHRFAVPGPRGLVPVGLCLLASGAAGADGRMAPDRAAALASAERAIVEERWADAQETLDGLAQAPVGEEAVLAARLDLALRRAGIDGTGPLGGPLPADVESAAALLERRPSPGHRSCLLLAAVAAAEGKPETASAWLARAVEAMPDDDASRFRRMLIDLERGATAEAAREGLELLRRGHACPATLQAAGQALVAEGRAREAVGPLERLVADRPDNAEAHSLLGAALLVLRRVDDALAHLRSAAELGPSPSRTANLGLALTLAGRAVEAVLVLERATAEHPDHAGSWNNLGVALAAAGRLSEAREALLRAIEIEPESPEARANLADVEDLMRGGGS